jgi:hypothetical protein
VVVEGVVAEGEEDLIPPAAVGGGRRVEEVGDQGPDVLDAGCLEVELGDQGSVGSYRAPNPAGGAWWEEKAPCSGWTGWPEEMQR